MNLNFFLLENCIAYNVECVLVVAVVMVVGVVVYALSMFWYSNGMKISYLWNATFSVGLSTVFRSVHLFLKDGDLFAIIGVVFVSIGWLHRSSNQPHAIIEQKNK